MNLGELAPEHADVEGFLDELNDKLQFARPTGWSAFKNSTGVLPTI